MGFTLGVGLGYRVRGRVRGCVRVGGGVRVGLGVRIQLWIREKNNCTTTVTSYPLLPTIVLHFSPCQGSSKL